MNRTKLELTLYKKKCHLLLQFFDYIQPAVLTLSLPLCKRSDAHFSPSSVHRAPSYGSSAVRCIHLSLFQWSSVTWFIFAFHRHPHSATGRTSTEQLCALSCPHILEVSNATSVGCVRLDTKGFCHSQEQLDYALSLNWLQSAVSNFFSCLEHH